MVVKFTGRQCTSSKGLLIKLLKAKPAVTVQECISTNVGYLIPHQDPLSFSGLATHT